MQLGISTYTYGWAVGIPDHAAAKPMTAFDLLEKAKAFGLHVVQFGDNMPLHAMDWNALSKLHQRATEYGIELEIGARGLTPSHLDKYINLAVKLKARLLRFVIDQRDYEPSLNEVVKIIADQVAMLKQHQITLGIENHDRLSSREFANIIEAVGSQNVGICLDSVNSMGAGEGLEQIVQTLAPYTVNLHIKDFGIERLAHLMGFQIDGRPAGKGMLNVPWLLEKMTPYGRCRTAILEQWVVPDSDIETTILKEEAWANESVGYLKPLFN